MNKNLININFDFSSGEKLRIKCNPYIKVKELIVYLLESLINNNNKFTINELRDNLYFLYHGAKIDINSSMQLDKTGIYDESHILVVNHNILFDMKNNIQEEISEKFNKIHFTELNDFEDISLDMFDI